MKKVKIVTDSTVDLTPQELEELEVVMVPLSITIDGETYLDKIEISNKEFMGKMKNSAELPKSSQPPAGVFVETYDKLAEDGSAIISIHMTGGMSGTVQSAESAASMTDADVTVFDSKFISKALAFQVVEAAKMAKEGKSAPEIINRLKHIRENTHLLIVIDTLDNLVKGGRLGRVSGIIGSFLNIKPIAMMDNGSLNPVTKVRSQSQIVKFIVKRFLEDTAGKTVAGIGMVHVDGNEAAVKVMDAIKEVSDFKNFDLDETTPVISTHAGPGAFAIFYYCE